jgi:hypothetical protein
VPETATSTRIAYATSTALPQASATETPIIADPPASPTPVDNTGGALPSTGAAATPVPVPVTVLLPHTGGLEQDSISWVVIMLAAMLLLIAGFALRSRPVKRKHD